MAQASPDVAAALATLRDRWGAAAPRRLIGPGEVVGALATVPLPDLPLPAVVPEPAPAIGPPPERVVPTGFAAVDAILGPGGVPRQAGLAVRGDHSSGKTTLALRLVAEAQASGSIVAWLDLGRSLDPVEAVARGVDLDWLVVLVPESLDEGLAMAGSLLQGHAVDLLVADLPPDRGARASRGKPAVADRLHRLGALARRADALLVVLEPPGLSGSMSGALAEVTGLRLELARRAWIRLGRDVVGQRTEVTVARNRFGAPGRRAEIQILYADGGERDACLDRADLLHDARPVSATAPPRRATGSFDAPASRSTEISIDATPSSSLAPSSPPPRPIPLHVVPDRGDRPGRTALDRGRGARREPGRPGSRRPAGDAARQRTSAGA
jgi:recombination protein RecA